MRVVIYHATAVQCVSIAIEDYKTTKIWLAELRHLKPSMTIQNYLWALQVFCEWTKKKPDQLISERLKEVADRSNYAKTQTYKRITVFQSEDKSKTKYSRDMIVKAMTSFYENNQAALGDPKHENW